jgi:hypothetical protein
VSDADTHVSRFENIEASGTDQHKALTPNTIKANDPIQTSLSHKLHHPTVAQVAGASSNLSDLRRGNGE